VLFLSRQELDDFEKEVVGKDINIPLVELTKVGDIKSDGLNPNVMDVQKFDALKKNIEKYGFIVPIITNKKLVIADGEHRLKAAEDLGMKEVPVLRLDVEEVDRRMLRQVLNKLKGVHDYDLDLEEFKFLYRNDSFDEFQELLAGDDSLITFLASNKGNEFEEDDFEEMPEMIVPEVKLGEVLDVFGGSGSTLIACEKANRNCYMMELDEHYCGVIIARWEDLTGLKAVKVK